MTRITLNAAAATAALGLVAPIATAQFIDDGDMDALVPGTNPDVGAPAGAWAWPENYVDAGVAEVDPSNFVIAETSSFDPEAEGNSLGLNVQEAESNLHLPNLLTEVINEGDGIVTVTFRIWVVDGNGGGSVYVGGDHGGGGFSNADDRGPQVSWFPDGTVIAWNSAGEPTVVANYPTDEWQTVVLEIDLVNDEYDMLWAAGDADPELVITGQTFRSGELEFLDRFSYVRFAGKGGTVMSFIDDVEVAVEAGCPADCNGDGVLNITDFLCFQTAWQDQTAFGDCNGDGVYDILDFICYQSLFQDGCP